jgi:hypothetical protein
LERGRTSFRPLRQANRAEREITGFGGNMVSIEFLLLAQGRRNLAAQQVGSYPAPHGPAASPAFEQRRQMRRRQAHHSVLYLRPAERYLLQDFANRHIPVPFQKISLIRSALLAQNTWTAPVNGSAFMCSRTNAAGLSTLLWKSTGLVATTTRIVPDGPITGSPSAHGRWPQSSPHPRRDQPGSLAHRPRA